MKFTQSTLVAAATLAFAVLARAQVTPATPPGQENKSEAKTPPGQTQKPDTPPGQAQKPETPPGQDQKPETPPGSEKKRTVNENASDNAKAVQTALTQFDAQRDQFASDRRAVLDRLKAAKTEEERKAALDDLRAQKRDQAEERRAMGKEIRDELKKLRDAKKG